MDEREQVEAWRTYAAAAITGIAPSITQDGISIQHLCQTASKIADEMVKREGEWEQKQQDPSYL